jgi:RimJ/RimL family protein N-acetyltransferase
MSERLITKKIKDIKGFNATDIDFLIPILKADGSKIGELKPVNKKLIKEVEIVNSLTKWREKFTRYFLTQFQPTIQRTVNWLNNVVVASDNKVLFLIYNENNKLIGHIGLSNISVDSVEIDNLVRGEVGGDKDLIFFSEIALIDWVFYQLNVPLIVLNVFSNNFLAINLHKEVGFSIYKEKELWKYTTGNDVFFSTNKGVGIIAKFKYIGMKLSKNNKENK